MDGLDAFMSKWGFPTAVLVYVAVKFFNPINKILVDYFSSFKKYQRTQIRILKQISRRDAESARDLAAIKVRVEHLDKKTNLLLDHHKIPVPDEEPEARPSKTDRPTVSMA